MTFNYLDRDLITSYVYKSLNHSIWYHMNRDRVRKQQNDYRQKNKDRVKLIWKKSSQKYRYNNREKFKEICKKYRNKNKLALSMYQDLRLLVKKENRW